MQDGDAAASGDHLRGLDAPDVPPTRRASLTMRPSAASNNTFFGGGQRDAVDDTANLLDELTIPDKSELQAYYDAFKRIQNATGIRTVDELSAKCANMESALETLQDQEVQYIARCSSGVTVCPP